MVSVLFPNPAYIDFMRWASVVTEELSNFGLNNPTGEENWASWATQIFNIGELVANGLPDPNGFQDWRTWAARCSDIQG